MTTPPSSAPAVAGVERNSALAHYSREALQGQREHIEKLEAENAQLREALEFYADDDRYNGGNNRVKPGDKYTPAGAAYRQDVTRDRGAIARAALGEAL